MQLNDLSGFSFLRNSYDKKTDPLLSPLSRKARFIIIVSLLFMAWNGYGSDRGQEIYGAFISSDMDRWHRIMDEMGQATGESHAFVLELVNYQYGYIAWCIGNGRAGTARKYLAEAGANLEILKKAGYRMSYVHAYQSAFYGFKIGLNRLSAPSNGPRSLESARLAVALDDKNPLGYLLLGNARYYMPAVFGGSKKDAMDHFLKAADLMEASAGGGRGDWNYLNLLVQIARLYEEQGHLKESREWFEKALQVEPRFRWVRDTLYPMLLQKMKKAGVS